MAVLCSWYPLCFKQKKMKYWNFIKFSYVNIKLIWFSSMNEPDSWRWRRRPRLRIMSYWTKQKKSDPQVIPHSLTLIEGQNLFHLPVFNIFFFLGFRPHIPYRRPILPLYDLLISSLLSVSIEWNVAKSQGKEKKNIRKISNPNYNTIKRDK